MGVNQGPGDPIPSTASADDQQLHLQNLQEEVDQIKVSIKRLLMDIREQMNNLENPFVHAPGEPSREVQRRQEIAPLENKIRSMQGSQDQVTPDISQSSIPTQETENTRDPLLDAIKGQIRLKMRQDKEGYLPEKLGLNKVHQIFKWTSLMVKKYGHDRLDLMLQSYRAMGYLNKDSCEQVREISRLMPASLGETHEISSGEFIRELYALNRILDPSDISLDRDMIHILMDKKPGKGSSRASNALKEKEIQEDWIHMPDSV